MENNKDIQVEDNPSLETPNRTSQPKTEPQVPVKPGFFKRVIPWVIVILVSFIAGAGLIYFTLYTRVNNAYTASEQNVATLTDKLSTSEMDLSKVKTELGTTQASLVNANNAAVKDQQLLLLYKFQADVNLARVSMLKLDSSTARQALSVAGDDLKALTATNINPDSISGLQPQLDTAVTNVLAFPDKASNALDTLYTNLLLISDNIQ
jgi:cytoskeletal protein RodZ